MRRLFPDLPEPWDQDHYRDDPHASAMDCQQARDALGWDPQGDWRSIEAAHTEFTREGQP